MEEGIVNKIMGKIVILRMSDRTKYRIGNSN